MSIFGFTSPDIKGLKAPELPPDLPWFNSLPLILKKLQGKVVLIDFWTYSCINCQRTLPYLKQWWKKYQNKGLVMIGVHAPEFEFEKDPQNVEKALKKYRVTWPVVVDSNYQIWKSYDNHYWPSKYLVDPKGRIIYTHIGEGNYLETESKIQEALKEAGFEVDMKLTDQVSQETVSLGQTPETYCGYLRGILGNKAGYQVDREFTYIPPDILEPNFLYLEGRWKAMPEYVEHTRNTKELEDVLLLNYRAKKVYLIMESAASKPIKVYITLDVVPLTKENAGSDIKFEPGGGPGYDKSYIEVQFSTLYNLVNTPTVGDHKLRISTNDKGLRAFAFTFGS